MLSSIGLAEAKRGVEQAMKNELEVTFISDATWDIERLYPTKFVAISVDVNKEITMQTIKNKIIQHLQENDFRTATILLNALKQIIKEVKHEQKVRW